jgi:hypothetical protein
LTEAQAPKLLLGPLGLAVRWLEDAVPSSRDFTGFTTGVDAG